MGLSAAALTADKKPCLPLAQKIQGTLFHPFLKGLFRFKVGKCAGAKQIFQSAFPNPSQGISGFHAGAGGHPFPFSICVSQQTLVVADVAMIPGQCTGLGIVLFHTQLHQIRIRQPRSSHLRK